MFITSKREIYSVWPVLEWLFRDVVRFGIVGIFRFFRVAKRNGGGCFDFGLTEGMRETGCRDVLQLTAKNHPSSTNLYSAGNEKLRTNSSGFTFAAKLKKSL